MNNTKFTKGEWEVVDGTLVGEEILFISVPCVTSKGRVVCRLTKTVDKHIPLDEEDKANAKLIAAAPEMYGYLSHMLEHDIINDRSIEREVKSLLAKARG